MNVLGVVLARGGSERLPGKNLLELGGKSLVRHAVESMHDSKLLTDEVLSTDSKKIAWGSRIATEKIVPRPAEISGPESTIEEALLHALQVRERVKNTTFDYVVALQASCPARPAGAIDACLKLLQEHPDAEGGVTCVRRSPWLWYVSPEGGGGAWWKAPRYPRSQDIGGVFLEEINSIQITPRWCVLEKRRWGNNIVLFELPPWCDVDIDNQEDFYEAEFRWENVAALSAWSDKIIAHPVRVYPQAFGPMPVNARIVGP